MASTRCAKPVCRHRIPFLDDQLVGLDNPHQGFVAHPLARHAQVRQQVDHDAAPLDGGRRHVVDAQRHVRPDARAPERAWRCRNG